MFGRDTQKKTDNPLDIGEKTTGTLRSSNPESQVRSTAMIGESIKIQGTITGAENLVIEGTVEGSVNLPDNDLTVGESGQVKADLNAKNVIVNGQVVGDIRGSEKVIISQTGRVKGNIVAPRVTLEDGAKFKGSIDMDPSETEAGRTEPRAASPTPKAQTEA